jgi:hypothetical protein
LYYFGGGITIIDRSLQNNKITTRSNIFTRNTHIDVFMSEFRELQQTSEVWWITIVTSRMVE